MGTPHRAAWVVSLAASAAACSLFVGDGDPFTLYKGPPDAARDSASSKSEDARPADGHAMQPPDAACASQLALVAGSSLNLNAAIRDQAGTWSASTIMPWKVAGVPLLFALPGSDGDGAYHAIVPTPNGGSSNALIDFVLNAGGATTPGAIASALTTNASAGGESALSIASLDGKLYVVFDGAYAERGVNAGYQGEVFTADAGDAGWSFLPAFHGQSPFPPAVAATSSYVVAAVGADAAADATQAGIVVEVLASGAWQPPSSVGDASTSGAPRMVALHGSQDDLLIVYPRSGDGRLSSIARDATSGTWSAPIAVADGVTTQDTPVVAAYEGGAAVLVTRDPGGQPFASVYSDSPRPKWSASIPFGPGAVSGPVTVGVGRCGQPFAAYALPSDVVRVVALEGTTWSKPEPVAGTLNATYLAIAAE